METQLGPETKLDAAIVDGGVKLSATYKGKQLGGEIAIIADIDQLIDAIGNLIPGDSAFEKGALELLKAALKSAKF